MEDWKEKAERALENLARDRQAIGGLRAQILQVKADLLTPAEPTDECGEDSSSHHRALLCKQKELQTKLAALTAHVEQVDRVLGTFSKRDMELIEELYFGASQYRAAAVIRLQHKHHRSRSGVYRHRDGLLWEFAYRMGWI